LGIDHIEVVPATQDEQSILANLLQLYAHDFSEFHDIELAANGRFEYKPLPLYWSEPQRHPFLVRIDGKLVGFAFVKRGSEVSGDAGVWDMAEFFVIRRFRRRGVGIQIAHQLWRRFRGAWEVRVMDSNLSAFLFWQRAISTFLSAEGAVVRIEPVPFEKDGERWGLFSFESKRIA
jgi:predicted acetyltransferase